MGEVNSGLTPAIDLARGYRVPWYAREPILRARPPGWRICRASFHLERHARTRPGYEVRRWLEEQGAPIRVPPGFVHIEPPGPPK